MTPSQFLWRAFVALLLYGAGVAVVAAWFQARGRGYSTDTKFTIAACWPIALPLLGVYFGSLRAFTPTKHLEVPEAQPGNTYRSVK